MPSVLLSGPAGGGKSQEAERRLAAATVPTVLVDFQEIYATLSGAKRGADGKYPLRDPALLPLVQYVRKTAIRVATRHELDVIVTNANGDPAVRAALAELMELPDLKFTAEELKRGPLDRSVSPGEPIAGNEEIIDPGEAEVRRRLASRGNKTLSRECSAAINRWYRFTKLR